MSVNDQRDDLLHDLQEDWESCFASGKLNNISDVTLSIVAVVASLVATVLAGTETAKWAVASVAAVPAACTTLQRLVDFRGRSNWYFRYSSNVRALANSLRFSDAPDLSDFARKWGALDIEMDRDRSGGRGQSPRVARVAE